jgi:hypothetical protein
MKKRDVIKRLINAEFVDRFGFWLGNPHPETWVVQRVKKRLGPNLIVRPSHEAILPNVPPHNGEAMAQAVFTEGDER